MSTNNAGLSPDEYSRWASYAVFVSLERVMKQYKKRVRTSSQLVLGLLSTAGAAGSLLRAQFHVQPSEVKVILASRAGRVPQGLGEEYRYSDGIKRVFKESAKYAVEYPFIHPLIHTLHVLLALIEVNDEEFSSLMVTLGVNVEELRVAVEASLKDKQCTEES
jgi:ATP-dependent Clp protease ATP-binding subunit ClpA